MSLAPTRLSLAAALVAVSSVASAQDVRVTCTGSVATIQNGGVGVGPFASAAVGDAVTLVADVEIAGQLPFGQSLGVVNWPSSSLTIGAATDGFAYTPGFRARLEDDDPAFGDLVAISSVLAADVTTHVSVFVFDLSGQSWSTDDWAAIVGTTVQVAGLESIVHVSGQQGGLALDIDVIAFTAGPGGPLGTPYCVAEPNSTGSVGLVRAHGLDTPADNDLTLVASGLPTQTFGYFLVGASQGFVAHAGGSAGNLCLSGSIGRFVGLGQIQQTDFGGEIALPVDLSALPTPTGSISVQGGETWNFQLWHRDDGVQGPTSNFTRGLEITFS